jgi:hypothetical protein
VPAWVECSVSSGRPETEGPEGGGTGAGAGGGVGVGLGVGVGDGIGAGDGPGGTGPGATGAFVASDDPPHPVNVTAATLDALNRNSRRFMARRT